MRHVDELTLMRLAEGELSRELEQPTRAHLIDCARCQSSYEAMKAETQLLRATVQEQDEALPEHIRPRQSDVSWVLVAMIAFGTLAISTLWTRYVQPVLESMKSMGLDGTSAATSFLFRGVLFRGWSDMLMRFIEGVVLLVLLVVAAYALRWGWRRLRSSGAASILLLVALTSMLLIPSDVRAAVIETEAETYTLPEGDVIENDLIVTGRTVRIEGTVVGDLIVAAGSVEVRGEVQGDVLGFAKSIEITGRVTGSVRTFSGSLDVDGVIGRNITAAGESVRLRPGASLGGSFIVGSQRAVVSAPVARDVIIGAEVSEIHARVNGSALLAGDRLRIGPDGGIGGEARFFGASEPDVSPEADLAFPVEFEHIEHDERQSIPAFLSTFFGMWAAAFVLGAAIMLVSPEATESIVATHIPEYGKSFLIGIVSSIVTFAFAVLVVLTLVGIPLGITSFFVLSIGLYVAQAYVGAFIGREILGTPTSVKQALGRLALGLLLVHVAKALPVVGAVVSVVVALWGFGALSLYVVNQLPRPATAAAAEAS